MKSFRRIYAIALKEFFHLRRDRLTFGMIAGIPLLLTLIFGYGINQDVRRLKAGVADLSGTHASRALIAASAASQIVTPVAMVGSPSQLQELLRGGEISVGIVIPADFESRLAQGVAPLGQILVDGSDPIVLSAARQLAAMPFSPRQTIGARAAHEARPQTLEVRAFYNPERRSAVFIVPGICGIILTQTLTFFAAASLVREKERGNIELLITTPIKTVELMIGKIIPFVLVGYVQVTIILLLGVLLFRVPILGPLPDLYLGVGPFIAATLALGLFISTVSATQFQSFQISVLAFIPQILLSGFMFPFEGMPKAVQSFAHLLPLTHFLRIIRGIMLKGATISDVWPSVWPLFLLFAGFMAFSILRFRKRLD